MAETEASDSVWLVSWFDFKLRRKGSSIALVFTLLACICVARKNQVFLFYKNDIFITD